MFCPNCGTQLEDDTVFCGECGTKMEESVNMDATAGSVDAQPYNAQQSGEFQQNTTTSEAYGAGMGGVYQAAGAAAGPGQSMNPGNIQPKKNTNIIMIAIAAIAVIAVILVVVLIAKGLGSNYKTPLKETVSLVNKRETNPDKFAAVLLPKFANHAYKDGMAILKSYDEIEDALDELKDSFDEMYDEADDEFGSNWKMSYKITDSERLDEDDLKDIKKQYKSLRDSLDELDDYLDKDGYYYEEFVDELGSANVKQLKKLVDQMDEDLKGIKITDGYDLEVELAIKGSDDEDDTEIDIRVIKINGKWTIDLFSVSNMLWSIY